MASKVAIFGDSISKGIIYENKKLLKLKDSMVNIVAEEYGLDVVNYSKYGQTLKKLTERNAVKKFLEEGGKKGDYAVFCIGGNDADYDWAAVAKTPLEEHLPFTPIDEFEALLSENITILQNAGVHVIITTIPPVDSQRYFKEVISKVTDGEKVLEFFDGDVTNISRSQECYNLALVKCAAKYGCPIIDLRSGFLLDRKYLRNYCEDGIHPNEQGHRFMAEEVINSLTKQGLVLKK